MSKATVFDRANRAARSFVLPGPAGAIRPYGNGHINDTFLLTCEDQQEQFILQRINGHVFREPVRVMENVAAVTDWIAQKEEAAGPNDARQVLELLPARDGKLYVTDEAGDCWRVYRFIANAVCYERPESEEIFYQSAVAFGRFQRQMADFPADSLHETIPHFHDTPVRYNDFLRSVRQDSAGRLAQVRQEVDFLMERASLADTLIQAKERGDLPLRVTHNDTKLNNVMFDRATGRAVCVLDLDTVMPGLSATDFGDAIRFGACTAAEDEPDPDKVHFDLHLYEVYTEGFLQGCEGALTPAEKAYLPDGALVITYEQALRFLADYLNGDVYYKTDRPGQNLDRARTQIRMLSEMEQQLDNMRKIVEKT